MAQAAPMLRLLQGDVGSGKTLVALMAMLTAVEAGAQAALLAPTEILARQHHATLLEAARQHRRARRHPHRPREGQGARESVLMGLADGSIDILVGTHAIFQEKVAYRNLGLAVIDEQHRFGVSQRLLLAVEGGAAAAPAGDDRHADPAHPDAHPIWRDGRQPDRRDAAGPDAGRNARDQRGAAAPRSSTGSAGTCRSGGQAYWVCPLVEESEKSDAAAAEERARVLRLRFGDDKVGLVHGRMKGPEKDAVMAPLRSRTSSRCWSRRP